jgi:hypothetical protein
MAGIVVYLGGIEERLGGDAALVEADASQALLLEQDYTEAGSPGHLGSGVSGRTTANDCYLVFHLIIY